MLVSVLGAWPSSSSPSRRPSAPLVPRSVPSSSPWHRCICVLLLSSMVCAAPDAPVLLPPFLLPPAALHFILCTRPSPPAAVLKFATALWLLWQATLDSKREGCKGWVMRQLRGRRTSAGPPFRRHRRGSYRSGGWPRLASGVDRCALRHCYKLLFMCSARLGNRPQREGRVFRMFRVFRD